MLAIMESQTIAHPPLECVFTVQEEVGLFGALGLDKKNIHGKRLINLDGGGEFAMILRNWIGRLPCVMLIMEIKAVSCSCARKPENRL